MIYSLSAKDFYSEPVLQSLKQMGFQAKVAGFVMFKEQEDRGGTAWVDALRGF